jgi:hypothetical protein
LKEAATLRIQAKRIQLLKIQLQHASSYQEWADTALQLDDAEGLSEWKHSDDEDSTCYDNRLIRARLQQLEELEAVCIECTLAPMSD